jgi:hypothetical protein
LCLTACEPAEENESAGGGTEGHDDAGAGPCDNEERAMEYASGLELTSENEIFRARLMDAMPAPPARYINDWSLEFELTDGGSLEDVEIEIIPWMPDHNHGSAAPITIAANEDGSVSATGIDLFMVGYWEVHIDLTAADESWNDRVTYSFCVE